MNMIPLLDSAIGFIAILLTLSLLVKSLTSLIKSYVDYYSEHLRAEVDQFLQGMLNQSLQTLAARAPWVAGINWKSLGEEYFTRDKMAVLLRQLDPNWVNLGDLDARIDLHVANLKYTFERKMKNLALATGLGLCLVLNVNALTIWKTLYTDQQIRTTFATGYAQNALVRADAEAKADQAVRDAKEKAGQQTTDPKMTEQEKAKKKLQDESKAFQDSTHTFLADVSFGVGRLWKEGPDIKLSVFLYELLGSLVTGILVSIGAPYWHDLLRALAGLRKPAR
jgi:hypothetical protein